MVCRLGMEDDNNRQGMEDDNNGRLQVKLSELSGTTEPNLLVTILK